MTSLSELNNLGREDFTRLVGPVFECSPWVAESVWPRRPFASLDALHRALCETVQQADESKQISLIQAHPDLVGRASLAGTITSESKHEQSSAGLDRLTKEEMARFQSFNQSYRDKFGFPFVICARLNKKEAILTGFQARLKNSREAEIQIALEEIGKIAKLRLVDLIAH